MKVITAFSATCWRRVGPVLPFSERLSDALSRPSPIVILLVSRDGVKFALLEAAEAINVPRRIVRPVPVKAEEPRRRTVPVTLALSMVRALPAMVPRRTMVVFAAAPIEEGAVNVRPRLAVSVRPVVAKRRPPARVTASAMVVAETAPKARSLEMAKVPPLTTVLPVFVLTPVRVKVPVPFLVRPPRPERTPE